MRCTSAILELEQDVAEDAIDQTEIFQTGNGFGQDRIIYVLFRRIQDVEKIGNI